MARIARFGFAPSFHGLPDKDKSGEAIIIFYDRIKDIHHLHQLRLFSCQIEGYSRFSEGRITLP
jgi:hypothetical protein